MNKLPRLLPCYTSNGCYVYCDGYQYDCPPFYLCP